jgi:hypothetical protein
MSKLVGTLYRLAKEGKKEQFVTMIEDSRILKSMSALKSKDIAMLIYGFNTLRLGNPDMW